MDLFLPITKFEFLFIFPKSNACVSFERLFSVIALSSAISSSGVFSILHKLAHSITSSGIELLLMP